MKKQLVGLVIMVMFLVGCTSMHDTSNLVIDEYVISIEEAKENAVKLAALSEFKTCFIRAALGSHIEKFMTDCQKGQMSGLWTRLVVLGILEIIADINPAALTGLL
jgi:hypothetical protein